METRGRESFYLYFMKCCTGSRNFDTLNINPLNANQKTAPTFLTV